MFFNTKNYGFDFFTYPAKDTFIFRPKAKAIDLFKHRRPRLLLLLGSSFSFYIMFSLQLKVVGEEGEQTCTLPST